MFDFNELLQKTINNLKTKPATLKRTSKWVKYNHKSMRETHCRDCVVRDRKIYPNDKTKPKLPAHLNCECYYTNLQEILAGEATSLGIKGADFYLKYYGKLPDYYIAKEEAETLGWNSKLGNLSGWHQKK